jgi:hypothetical protein
MKRLILAAMITAAFRPVQPPNELRQDLLQRAGEYVRQFEAEFRSVLTDEVYDQDDFWPRAKIHRRRHLRSEMLFMRVPGPELSWMTARNVLEVDGKPVPDSGDRLERALKGDEAGLVSRMRAVRDEGARFNVGSIERNINDPIIPLLFVDPDYRWRFDFSLGPQEKVDRVDDVDGVPARSLSFREISRPTVIRQGDGLSDVLTTGTLWVVPGSGIVVRTELRAVVDATEVFFIAVDYRREPRLGMWIPSRMTEKYRLPRNIETITCTATYSNARRFETSARIVK